MLKGQAASTKKGFGDFINELREEVTEQILY